MQQAKRNSLLLSLIEMFSPLPLFVGDSNPYYNNVRSHIRFAPPIIAVLPLSAMPDRIY